MDPLENACKDWRSVDWAALTHVVDLDGREVSYVDTGPSDAPVLLLVHGLGASWRVWLENLPTLTQEHRVLAVDLPGFGASPVDQRVLSVEAYAGLLADLLVHLGVSSAVAVGNSFGGWVSAELARSRPDLVRGLVLVAAAGIPGTRAERLKVVGTLKVADRLAPLGCRQREAIARRPRLRRQALGFLVARGDRLPGDLAIHLLPETPSPVFRTVLERAVAAWSEDWLREINLLDVPALVVWGELDRQLPLRHAHRWTRLLKGSTLVTVPGAGHMPMLEDPRRFHAALLPFLQELAG